MGMWTGIRMGFGMEWSGDGLVVGEREWGVEKMRKGIEGGSEGAGEVRDVDAEYMSMSIRWTKRVYVKLNNDKNELLQ
jgi:hypothetical protein